MARVETVRIEGLAQLDRALRELPQRIANRGLRASVYAGAKVIRDEARSRAPKAAQSLGPKQPPPGTLKRSVIMKHMGLYCAAKTAAFAAALTAGAGWGEATLHAWTEADQALWAGVLNFWFLGRVFDRVRS